MTDKLTKKIFLRYMCENLTLDSESAHESMMVMFDCLGIKILEGVVDSGLGPERDLMQNFQNQKFINFEI